MDRFIVSFAITAVLLMVGTVRVLAAPPLPARVYGTVQFNSSDLPPHTPISAWINGVKVAETTTFLENGGSVFRIDIPGDDPDTPAIEGGVDGQIITFQIAGATADQTALWSRGGYTRLDLTATVTNPDLTVTKDDGQPVVVPGERLTYTVTIGNVGNQAATGVQLTDALPAAGVTFVAASHGGSAAGGSVTWPPFTVAAGSEITRTVTVDMDNPLMAGVEFITNTVTVADDGAHGVDPTPDDNRATDVNTVLAAPDLLLSKNDGQSSVVAGQTVTYTLTISNIGNQAATGVTVTDTLPANVGYLAASHGGGPVGGAIAWPAFDLAGGASVTRTVTVAVDPQLPARVEAIVNVAWVADDGSNGPDPTPLNNSASDTNTVLAAPDLSISKDDGQSVAPPGSLLTYTLTITNSGAQDAVGVTVSDFLPPGVTFVAASDGGMSLIFEVNWPAFALAAGETVLRTVTVRVDDTAPPGQTIINNAFVADDGTNGPDPTPDDNSAIDRTTVSTIAPDVTAGGNQQGDEGETIAVTASFSNAGPPSSHSHTATITWGDGAVDSGVVTESGGSGTVAGSHVYGDNGAYVVEICVADNEGDVGCDSLDVTVDNLAPTIAVGPDQSAGEGETVALSAISFADAGTLDTHTATIDWGDGESEAGSISEVDGSGTISGTHAYGTDGLYTVEICVSDDDGSDACDAFAVTVANLPPVVEAGPNQTATRGGDVNLIATAFSDPGFLDTHTATVDWGDGSDIADGTVDETDGAGTVTASHVFANVGAYEVEICVTDSELAVGCDTFQVTVAAVPPDLQVRSLDRTNLVGDWQSLAVTGSISAEIVNQGDDPALGSFATTFFEDANDNAVFDPDLDTVLGLVNQDGLAAGASVTVSSDISDTVAFRDNLVYAFVDSAQVITEHDEANNYGNSGQVCEFVPPADSFDPVVKFHALEGLNIISTPMVVNLTDDNGDGSIDENDIPDIVFSTAPGGQWAGGPVTAISGDDGRELFNTLPHTVASLNEIAVADIDDDGLPEIVGALRDQRHLQAFEHTGEFKWQSDLVLFPGRSDSVGAISIANLDNQGRPEIVIGSVVFDADGKLLGDGRDLGGDSGFFAYTAISAVADIDLDGTPEVVAGPSAYRLVNGSLTLVWDRADRGDGFVGIANFDEDPFAEIVIVSGGSVYMLNHDGTNAEVWNPPTSDPVGLPGGGNGPPTIGDFDGDGIPEIGIAGTARYTVFERDGSVRWTSITEDLSSGTTGSTLFDFDGNGEVEVVYRDEYFLRIYQGRDGSVLYERPMRSSTATEMPVVADVDNDGNAEIIVASDRQFGGTIADTGIYVIEDAADTWVDTRRIWNQHSYHITNIDENGSVPLVETNNWETHNNYRLNVQVEGSVFGAPDLSASYLRSNQSVGSISLTARIGNGGAAQAGIGIPVAFYLGDPATGGTLLGVTSTTKILKPGEYEDISFDWLAPPAGTHEIYVQADDDGTGASTQNECDEQNNLQVGIVDQNPLSVTVAYFESHRSGDMVEFAWQTATESGTAGFDLLASTGEETTLLNEDLIASPVVDSVIPIDYQFHAQTDATVFYLEEVSVEGARDRYGPFELGTVYGNRTETVNPDEAEMQERIYLPLIGK